MINRFEYLFQQHILLRGLDYYEDGRVASLNRQGLTYEAIVAGSYNYSVNISLDVAGDVAEMACSCPYAVEHSACKHMAAVLFAIDYRDAEPTNISEQSTQKVTDVIDTIDTNELKGFIIQATDDDSRLAEAFINYFSHYFDHMTVESYKYKIDKIFLTNANRNGVIDYYNADTFGLELCHYIKSFANLVYSEHQPLVLQLIDYTLKKLLNASIDDAHGTTNMIINELMDVLENLIIETDVEEELYNDIFDYVIDLYELPEFYCIGHRWDDLFNNYFFTKEYLLKKMTFVNNKIEAFNDGKKEYYNEPFLMKFDLMQQLQYPVEEIIAFMKKNSDDETIALRLGQFYFDLGQFDEGIEVFNRVKKHTFYTVGEAAYRCLIEHYLKTGSREALINELLEVSKKNSRHNYDYYQLLKQQYKPLEWKTVRQDIIAQINFSQMDHLRVLAEEELYEQLMLFFEKHLDASGLMGFEEQLKGLYPQRILNLYQQKCEEMIQYTYGREHYRRIATYLKCMRKYPDGIPLVNSLIDKWIKQYSRRRAMKEELLKVRDL